MRKSIYILEPFIVYIIIHDAVQFVMYLLINRLVTQDSAIRLFSKADASYVTSGVQIISMLLGMLGVMLFEKMMHRCWNTAGEKDAQNGNGSSDSVVLWRNCTAAERKRYILYIVPAVLQMLLLAFSLNVLFLNTGFGKWFGSFAEVSNRQTGIPVVMAVLLFGMVSPVVEEYLFRGMLYVRLKELFSTPLSIGMSALFFGIYHGNLVQGIYGFIMGLFLAYIYESCRKAALPLPLFGVMLCHAAANLLIYFSGRYGLIEKVPVYVGAVLLLGTLAYSKWRAGRV